MSDSTAPKSGSSAIKIILIVLVVIVALGIGAVALVIGGIGFLAHRIVEKHGDKTTLNVPGQGSITSSSSITARDLGTDIYPGATPTEGGHKLTLPSGTTATGIYLTADPVSKVEAFYKDKFGANASDFNMDSTVMLTKKVSDKESITVTATQKPDQDGGKTKILIMHTTTK